MCSAPTRPLRQTLWLACCCPSHRHSGLCLPCPSRRPSDLCLLLPLPADPLAYACCSPQKQQLLAQQAHLQQQLLRAVGDDGEESSRQQALASRRIFVGNLAYRMVGGQIVSGEVMNACRRFFKGVCL